MKFKRDKTEEEINRIRANIFRANLRKLIREKSTVYLNEKKVIISQLEYGVYDLYYQGNVFGRSLTPTKIPMRSVALLGYLSILNGNEEYIEQDELPQRISDLEIRATNTTQWH